jgi:signal transduction histidine kinase
VSETDDLLAEIEVPAPVVWGERVLAVAAALVGIAGAFAIDGRDQATTALLLCAMASPWLIEAAGVTVPPPLFATMVLAPPGIEVVVGWLLAGPDAWRDAEAFGFGSSSSIYLVMLLLLALSCRPRRQLVATAAVALAVYGVRSLLQSGPYSRLGWAIALLFTLGACAGVRAGAVGIARAQRAAVARDAADHRRRIARDVHDVVAHTLAVTMLHITAARMALLRADTGAAAEALDEAERSGRSSLADVHRLTRILRNGQGGTTTTAGPTVADIPVLIGCYAAAGLAIDDTLTGPLDAVGPATGRAIYRVVQEALANAARHGEGSATVELRVDDGAVALEVRNPIGDPVPAPTPATATATAGNGIGGMRERVEAIGGTLEVGPNGDDRWRVRVEVAAG